MGFFPSGHCGEWRTEGAVPLNAIGVFFIFKNFPKTLIWIFPRPVNHRTEIKGKTPIFFGKSCVSMYKVHQAHSLLYSKFGEPMLVISFFRLLTYSPPQA